MNPEYDESTKQSIPKGGLTHGPLPPEREGAKIVAQFPELKCVWRTILPLNLFRINRSGIGSTFQTDLNGRNKDISSMPKLNWTSLVDSSSRILGWRISSEQVERCHVFRSVLQLLHFRWEEDRHAPTHTPFSLTQRTLWLQDSPLLYSPEDAFVVRERNESNDSVCTVWSELQNLPGRDRHHSFRDRRAFHRAPDSSFRPYTSAVK